MASLNAVHKGYNYQDLVSAYAFAKAFILNPKEIIVDQKKNDHDLFDDLRIKFVNHQLAHQFKFSEDPLDKFTISDIKTKQRDLRLDYLINSIVQDPDKAVTKYFIVTTLLNPEDDLNNFLLPSSEVSIFSGQVYKLNPDLLWPAEGSFVWTFRDGQTFDRSALLELCEKLYFVFTALRPSFDLREPGFKEKELFTFLKSEIGIGHYPNQEKNVFDTSSALLNLATRARQSNSAVTVEQISQYIQLRTDYGRISQSFPVDTERLINRKTFLNHFLQFIQDRRVSILTGPPGAGKSWFVDTAITRLRESETFVIYHYCYVSPFDTSARERINQKVLYGNLVSELLKLAPHLQAQHRPFFSATKESFESLVKLASAEVEKIYLVVDGLDHISRVLYQNPEISAVDAKIIEDLSTLTLPENVHLILSTQPGSHIAQFIESENIVTMPPWQEEETKELLEKKLPYLKTTEENWQQIVTLFHSKSGGNPLYLTYLISDFSEIFKNDSALTVAGFLDNQITLGNDIAAYYEHLLTTAQSRGIAEAPARLFGLVEFSLKDSDISEILGPIAAPIRTVRECLDILRPVLTHFESQGGYRIYHESFRRFVFDRLAKDQISLPEALAPIVDWLEKKGFYKNAISFKYLIPLLLRSNQNSKALSRIDINFCELAVQHGYGYGDIDNNLLSATDACLTKDSIPHLIRIWEFRRAIYEVFEGKFVNEKLQEKYHKCLGDLNGWESLRDSLLYEGLPIFEKKKGLAACLLCDENNLVAPWKEYLDLPDAGSSHDNDQEQDLDNDIAVFVGRCRTNPNIINRIKEFLSNNKNIGENYLRGIITQAVRIFGSESVVSLIEEVPKISGSHKLIAFIAIAKELKKTDEKALDSLKPKLIEICKTQSYAQDLLQLGFNLKDFSLPMGDITKFNIGLGGNSHNIDEANLTNWINSIAVASINKPEEVVAFVSTIPASSWYFCWLRFTAKVILIISDASKDQSTRTQDLLNELEVLAKFDKPFVGEPRACDLYNIHGITEWSFQLVLSNLQFPSIVSQAINSLTTISENSTTSLQGSPNGPIIRSALLGICLKTIKSPDLFQEVSGYLSNVVSEAEGSQYYDTLADHQLFLARIYLQGGKKEEAINSYQKACMFLTCYGHRKDPTIYELIDSMQAAGVTTEKSLEVANKTILQLRAVQAHTDGKGTSRVFVSWFSNVLSFLPESALVLLGDSINSPTGFTSWETEDCIEKITSEFSKKLDINTFLAIELGLRPDNRFEIDSARMKGVFSFLEKNTLTDLDSQRLAAHLIEDSNTRKPEWIEQVSKVLSLDGSNCYAPSSAHRKLREDRKTPSRGLDDFENFNSIYEAVIKGNTPKILRSELSKLRFKYIDKDSSSEILSTAIGYRICEFLQNGQISEYEETLNCINDELSFSSHAHFWEYIGEGLLRHGYVEKAAEAFVMSHCRSKEGGWLVLGGDASRNLLLKAVELAPETAISKYLEMLRSITTDAAYNYGLTRHLIEDQKSLGNEEIALASWDVAYDVISRRLPATYKSYGPFSHELENIFNNDFESAIIYLICCRLTDAEQRRKTSAISAISNLIKNEPIKLKLPLKRLLSLNSSDLTVSIIFRLIEEFENDPYLLTQELRSELIEFADTGHFFISETARLLLKRIGINLKAKQIPVNANQLIMQPKRDLMNWLDWGRRLHLIHDVDPKITSLIMYDFNKLSNKESFKSVMKDRLEHFQSRSRDGNPQTRNVGWYSEEFDRIINEHLTHYSLSPRTGEQIRNCLMPNMKQLIDNWNSRRLRKNYPFPEDILDMDETNVHEVQEGELRGWKILGRAEEQHLSENYSYKGLSLAVYGVIFHDGVVDYDMPPLGDEQDIAPVEENDLSWIVGPIHSCLFRYLESHWKYISTITLDPNLVKRMKLKEISRAGPVRYVNQDDEVVCRVLEWSSWFPGPDISEEHPLLKGSMLVVSPSFWDSLKASLGKNVMARTRSTVI